MRLRLRHASAVVLPLLLLCGSRPGVRTTRPHAPGPHDPLAHLTAEDVARMASADEPVRGAAFVDVDRDGDADVITSSIDAPIVVWVNDGNGRFTRRVPPSTPLPGWGSAPGFDEAPPASTFVSWPSVSRTVVLVAPTRLPRAPDVHAAVAARPGDILVLQRPGAGLSSRAPPPFSLPPLFC